MAWEELDFDKAHVAYFILGGFTSLFMLCSLFIKEKLYIGEATVATLVGVIFGPHAANLFDPSTWGNVDKITLELSRIVLVVQCFAIGVELPKAYMERHWRSILFLLVPIMTIGWLVTSVIIYLCINPLEWLPALAIAACVTATDPVLASSVVGKGKFAKRVPKHLRDVLSAESGCNDGMAFPFIYLSFYLLQYHSEAKEVTFHWMVLIILYECVFGAFYGFMVGYIGRHAIKLAERKNLIDRDSFLVFYFVLALFCAGSASGLGLDDLLVGFAAGVGFSNDGWFVEKTEESHVSNVIDLLLNLSYFVFLGAIIPWQDYNAPEIGLQPWRLVIIAIAVILFRRIPAMLLMKPLIPDVKNWREALFAGHFGPIGVGAVFAVILLRAELETDSTEPLATLPGPENEFYLLIRTSWPIVSFIVISSILVHGSSIAVFTLGKRINTLTLTMSYTVEGEQNWMDRLPRIASRSKSMSRNSKLSDDSSDEKAEFPPGTLGPVGVPRNFLRRQKEEEGSSRPGSIFESRKSRRRRRTNAGGPIDESAIGSVYRQPPEKDSERKDEVEDEDATPGGDMDDGDDGNREDTSSTQSPEVEAYREGDDLIVEDEEGNVLDRRNVKGEDEEQVKQDIIADRKKLGRETSGEHAKNRHHPHTKEEGEEIEDHIIDSVEHPHKAWRKWLGQSDKPHHKPKQKPHSGAAQAYQYGNKIIVEDADGEVVKTYDIPRGDQSKKASGDQKESGSRPFLERMNTWKGFGKKDDAEEGNDELVPAPTEDEDDKHVRFRLGGSDRRMSKTDFIKQIQSLDPKTRIEAVQQVDASEDFKSDVQTHAKLEGKLDQHSDGGFLSRKFSRGDGDGEGNFLTRKFSRDDGAVTPGGIGSFLTRKLSRGQSAGPSTPAAEASRKPEASTSRSPNRQNERPSGSQRRLSTSTASSDRAVDSQGHEIPLHDVHGSISAASEGKPETGAQLRRRLAAERAHSHHQPAADEDSDDDGTERIPPALHHRRPSATFDLDDEEETAAERSRRLAALGLAETDEDSDSERRTQRPAPHSSSSLTELPRAHIRDRAVGAGGTGGVAGNVKPNATIAEEPGETSPPMSPRVPASASSRQADEPPESPPASPPVSPSVSDAPKNPGIRFAEPPRGEGRGRSRRFGRTMGMRTHRKNEDD